MPTQPTGISVPTAAVLLIADNIDTGILALPGQAAALGGRLYGSLLILGMAPLCWYAGIALHRAATLTGVVDSQRPIRVW